MIGTIISICAPLVIKLLPVIENAFKNKPKSGQEKMDTVMSMVTMFLNGLMQNGLIDKTPLDKASPEIKGAIEQLLSDMKKNGTLVSPQDGPVQSVTQYTGVVLDGMIILRPK